MNKGRKGCQLQATNFFEKLSSWREESNIQFSNILNSHGSLIHEGIKDLVKENSILQEELSVIKNERSGLLKTVDNLNDEIRQLRTNTRPLREPKEDLQDIPEGKRSKKEIIEVQGQELRSIETNDHEAMEDYVEMSEQDIQEQNKCPQSESDTVNVICHDNDLANQGVHDIRNYPLDLETPDGQKQKTDETRMAADQKIKEVPLPLKMMYQCDVCGYNYSKWGNLKRHESSVHKLENKTFICEICPDTFKTQGGLEVHKNSRHRLAYDKKFECNLCPYKAFYSGELKKHIKIKHVSIYPNMQGNVKKHTSH